MNTELFDALARIASQLDGIAARLGRIESLVKPPPVSGQVTKISSTASGSDGQVIPGSLILEGEDATDYFQALGKTKLVALSNLPPWTHLAQANGSWWLVQMA